jgi:hypothetical protein
VERFRRRLAAQKRFYGLFFGGLVCFAVFLIAGLHRVAFGVSGSCFLLAGVYAFRYRREIRVDVSGGRIQLLPSLEDRPASESVVQAVSAGVTLVVGGAVWLAIAAGLFP